MSMVTLLCLHAHCILDMGVARAVCGVSLEKMHMKHHRTVK